MSTGLLSWRMLTACLVIAACGFAGYRGWQITSLVRVIDARGAVADERERLGAFTDTFGVGHFALTELRRLPAEPGPPQDQAAIQSNPLYQNSGSSVGFGLLGTAHLGLHF